MPSNINLAQRWQRLLQPLNVEPLAAQKEFSRIEKAYSQNHRAYHNLSHLQHFYHELDALDSVTPAMEFALFYHDIVYRPGSKANEQESAQWAKETMTQWQVDRTLIDRVYQLIMATQSHQIAVEDRHGAEFLDADMAILGSPWQEYIHYADAIAQEHKRYPKFLYKSGRKKFLSQTLTAERLFLSDHFYHRYEHQARANITKELEMLG